MEILNLEIDWREDSFIKEYAEQLKELIDDVPDYQYPSYRLGVAFKMIRSIALSTDNRDCLKHNPAMRATANKFGIKTSKEFREYVRELWANGWLQKFNWNVAQ